MAQARGVLGSTPGTAGLFTFLYFRLITSLYSPAWEVTNITLFATNFVTYWFMFEGMCSSCMCMVDIKQSLVYTQNIKGNKQLAGDYTGLTQIHIVP